jgi:hypothetical protein
MSGRTVRTPRLLIAAELEPAVEPHSQPHSPLRASEQGNETGDETIICYLVPLQHR